MIPIAGRASAEPLVTLEEVFETTAFPAAPGTDDKAVPNYRIPALVMAPNGDLLAFVERRSSTFGDIGDTDIVMRRSTDGGRTWGDIRELYTEHFYANSDATPLVDSKGRIWLFFVRDRRDFVVMHSDDSGHTWSDLRSIHDQFVEPEWDRFAGGENPGPESAANQKEKSRRWKHNWHQRYGIGCGSAAVEISEGPHTGRIVVPFRLNVMRDGKPAQETFALYTDDRGQSWQHSKSSIRHGNEAQIVELAGGRLMLNSRDSNNRHRPDRIARIIAYSDDGGDTWYDRRDDRTLVNPQVHAATHRYTHDGRDALLVTLPSSQVREEQHPYGRRNLSMHVSFDEGRTWSEPQTIYPYTSSYSDIVTFPDGTIGIIYERGPEGSPAYWRELAFVRLKLHWSDAAGLVSAAFPLGVSEPVDLYEVGVGPGKEYTSIRIPSMVVTGDGSILVWTSARRKTSDWADMDLLLRRSTDGGRTWTPPEVFVSGQGSVVDNATAIVARADRQTVHFLYQTDYAKLWHRQSTDGGKTFSPPRDVTTALDKTRDEDGYQWTILAPGPGTGAQLASGRLVAPVWLSNSGTHAHRPSVVTTVYSDDDGKTWQAGDIVVRNTDYTPNPSESIIVATPDGGAMLNIRSESSEYRRAVSFSPNGATQWTEPELVDELYDPICHASMTWLPAAAGSDQRQLAFVNPNSHTKTQAIRKWGGRPRENLTLRISKDRGHTWPISKQIDPGRSAYSATAVGPDGTLYIIYERGYMPENDLNTRWLSFIRIDLEEFLGE
ncbi:sialidase family protein [Aeoliella sp.]|uniref:sialidase family protein n=1 Tax=Aeoliella sp. TaxID=2795800 RepID=UPI003CCB84C7